jgi:hypothetical protein
MLKLIMFAPCEKVIVNKSDNTTPLITLLERVSIVISESVEGKLPADAAIPFRWTAFALLRSEENESDQYE